MNQGEQDERSWSKKYYPGLSEEQHAANDKWFRLQLSLLLPGGVLGVPNIKKFYNQKGEELK